MTRVVDQRTRGVREAVHGPLMPLAEWLVSSWWYLLYEAPPTIPLRSPRAIRSPIPAWYRRHNLLHAREGNPLPDLTIARADASDVLLRSYRDPRPMGSYPVQFTEECELLVRREAIVEQLRGLVETVLEWLSDCSSEDAIELREAWSQVRAVAGDDRLLRARAAALGLDGADPWSVPDELAAQLVDRAASWPSELVEDLLETGNANALEDRFAWVEGARAIDMKSVSPSIALDRARDVAREARAETATAPAYRLGWRLVEAARGELLGLSASAHGEQVDQALAGWIDVQPLSSTVLPLRGWVCAHGALVAALPASATEVTRRWLRARALCVAWLGGRERLVTDAQSWSQSVSRAFATELVAPVAWLRGRVKSDVIGESELGEIASEIGAPPRAVQHQLENHDIARVE
ncbi:MAG: hypothetical protein KF729_27075 [Sandaracinaceae bacterium]|nr:hypothetical protein [Sandaracinaceae bacterium]